MIISLSSSSAQARSTKCKSWHDRILKTDLTDDRKVVSIADELNLNSSSDLPFSKLSDQEVFSAMDCLLRLKGNRHPSRFAAATRPDISDSFDAPTVEVAALYYISYLFLQRWDHGSAILLIGRDGERNGIDTIQVAYRSYKLWLTELKTMGLADARKEGLDPLNKVDVRWY